MSTLMMYSILMIGIGIGGILTVGTYYAGAYLEKKLEKKNILIDQNEARKHINIDIK